MPVREVFVPFDPEERSAVEGAVKAVEETARAATVAASAAAEADMVLRTLILGIARKREPKAPDDGSFSVVATEDGSAFSALTFEVEED